VDRGSEPRSHDEPNLLNRKPAVEMMSRLEYLSTWGADCATYRSATPSTERVFTAKHFRGVLFQGVWVYSGVSREAGTVKFCVLASGSSGNAALWLLKTRVSWWTPAEHEELRRRLEAIGEDLGRIDAILITHEHSDHVAGLPVLARSETSGRSSS